MFTEEDIFNYFDQIQSIEKKMYRVYQDLHDQLSHPDYRKIFGQLANDEQVHDAMIQGLKNLLAG